MAMRTPALCAKFGVDVNARSLVRVDDESKFETITGDPGDGQSPSCSIHDEYHEHADDGQVDTMQTGMGARDQPLQVLITTAGDNLAGPCYARLHDERQKLAGIGTTAARRSTTRPSSSSTRSTRTTTGSRKRRCARPTRTSTCRSAATSCWPGSATRSRRRARPASSRRSTSTCGSRRRRPGSTSRPGAAAMTRRSRSRRSTRRARAAARPPLHRRPRPRVEGRHRRARAAVPADRRESDARGSVHPDRLLLRALGAGAAGAGLPGLGRAGPAQRHRG
jgi:hypothetical protein